MALAGFLVIAICKWPVLLGWLMRSRWRGKSGREGRGSSSSSSRSLHATIGLLQLWLGRSGSFIELTGQRQLEGVDHIQPLSLAASVELLA